MNHFVHHSAHGLLRVDIGADVTLFLFFLYRHLHQRSLSVEHQSFDRTGDHGPDRLLETVRRNGNILGIGILLHPVRQHFGLYFQTGGAAAVADDLGHCPDILTAVAGHFEHAVDV